MADDGGDPEDRTEAPTARRLQRAEDEGQLPVSREVALLAGLAAAAFGFAQLNGGIGTALARLLSRSFEGLPERDPEAPIWAAASIFAWAVGPFLVVVLAAGAAATLAQTRLSVRSKAVSLDFSRLSPGKGLARMFGPEALVETGKSIAKLVFVLVVIVVVLRQDLGRLEQILAAPLGLLPERLVSIAMRLLIGVVLAQTLIAAVDYVIVFRKHARQLRMSRNDIRDEMKETDGDPAIKARIRRIRLSRARQRMLSAVRTATVVVTNPTHYAAALAYNGDANGVPRLVAKGMDTVAARIRDAARDAGIPIVENPPLARALHQLPLNSFIPPELYKTVAELIAYVWRLGERRAR